ncbi:MAG TPA: bifunctional phosphopantothenoylcysteine decarboxylase/phosphopantothenate--cysteine ligase CoaBC [Deltaproteobacteria bacterium]|nr:bifunctional phosphopantothenoylcysteine decarboxylase/phosphopantothenate--cysteine ligase CoaBC [Deltaproteobacteria bacterium]
MKNNLKNQKILLGVCGGIAAYKACELVRRLTERGAELHVILTDSARQFVTPLSFQALSQNPVHTDLFNLNEESEMSHIKLADEADAVVIAPATADMIAKLAHGLADDLLSTAILVTRAPIYFAPSMNVNMWDKAVVQENIHLLQKRGFHMIEPGEGYLACGWEGKGRMAEPEEIVAAIETPKRGRAIASKKKSLAGLKVLINAGPTREYLDPVRFLSNPSSGKMGFALAAAAAERGAAVTLVSGPVALPTPPGVRRIDVDSAEEMLQACRREVEAAALFIATAAVGDYAAKLPFRHKLKKSGQKIQMELVPTVDILKTIGLGKGSGQVFVGFAAETDSLEKYAAAKLKEKNLDLIVANDVSKKDIGFAGDYNRVTLLFPSGRSKRLPKMTKTEIASRILDEIEALLSAPKTQRNKN